MKSENEHTLKRTATIFTLIGMVAMSIIFLFTTFEQKSDAETKHQEEAKVVQVQIDAVRQDVSSLHQDMKDFHLEVMGRLDKMAKSHK